MHPVILWFWLPFALTFAYALTRGGAPERGAAMLLIAAAAATWLAKPVTGRYVHPDIAIVLIDAALLAALALLAVKANRTWPVFLAGSQALVVLAHLSKAINPAVWSMAYWLMLTPPQLVGLLVLAAGTWRHRRRLALGTADPSWKASSRATAPPSD